MHLTCSWSTGEPDCGFDISRGFWTSRARPGRARAARWRFSWRPPACFAYYYVQFGRMINQRLTGQIYQNTSRVYSAPGRIYVGESLRASDLTTYLLRAGYQESAVDGFAGRISRQRLDRRDSALARLLLSGQQRPSRRLFRRSESPASPSFPTVSSATSPRSSRN